MNSFGSPPHVHVSVVDGWQYAALAKKVNGVKDEICAVDSVVMACRACREGAAWTDTTRAPTRATKSEVGAIAEVGGRGQCAGRGGRVFCPPRFKEDVALLTGNRSYRKEGILNCDVRSHGGSQG